LREAIDMFVGPFEFEEGGRSYRCCVEQERSPRAGVWWWFAVSSDTQRYAPFHPAAGDTKQSIRDRITEYYNNILVRRAMPAVPRYGRRGQGYQPAGGQATPVAVATEVKSVDESPNESYSSAGGA
jgi:hypothetical protein